MPGAALATVPALNVLPTVKPRYATDPEPFVVNIRTPGNRLTFEATPVADVKFDPTLDDVLQVAVNVVPSELKI